MLIAGRYCGPSRSGNGGYVSGSLAHELGDTFGRAVTVTLRQPPPLDSGMRVSPTDTGLSLTFGGATVAEAAYADSDVEPVEGVSWEEATQAAASYPGLRSHPFPTVLRVRDRACGRAADLPRRGPARHPAGALAWRRRGPLTARSRRTGTSTTTRPAGRAWPRPGPLWTARAGGPGTSRERLMVLGRMTAVVDELPVVGEPHVVVAEHRGGEGRRTFTAATLHDSDGRIVGRAEHTWVAVDPAGFNG